MKTSSKILLILIVITFLASIILREEKYLFLGTFLFVIFAINNYEGMEDEDDEEPPTQFIKI